MLWLFSSFPPSPNWIPSGVCSLFKLFQHPSLALVKGAGQIMKAIIEEGSQKVVKKIQHGALVVCVCVLCLCVHV